MAAVFSRIQALPENAVATLHRSEFGKVEFLRCNGKRPLVGRREFAAQLHFTLPLSGCFVWHAERENVFADPTTLLCTRAGEPFRMSHPHGGDQSLVLSPSAQLVALLTERFGTDLFTQRRIRIAPAHAQWIAHTFYIDLLRTEDVGAADECLLKFFETIAAGDTQPPPIHDETLVRRTLDYVHHTPEPQLSLQHVAAALQVRAPYLTHVFSQHMGQPLYRYIMSLKLSRALYRITAGEDDLTQIALDLGFSSHSHLSSAFKARYGRSPSMARRSPGGRDVGSSHISRGTGHIGADSDAGRKSPLHWRPLCAARGGGH